MTDTKTARAWADDAGVIHITRTAAFIETARAVNDYMNKLGLPAPLYNKLTDLMVEHVKTAEECAFRQGLQLGLDYGKAVCHNPVTSGLVVHSECMPRWISVMDTLPEEPQDESQEYIVMIADAKVATTLFYAGGGEWIDDDGHLYRVTHWMPLPEPPEME